MNDCILVIIEKSLLWIYISHSLLMFHLMLFKTVHTNLEFLSAS